MISTHHKVPRYVVFSIPLLYIRNVSRRFSSGYQSYQYSCGFYGYLFHSAVHAPWFLEIASGSEAFTTFAISYFVPFEFSERLSNQSLDLRISLSLSLTHTHTHAHASRTQCGCHCYLDRLTTSPPRWYTYMSTTGQVNDPTTLMSCSKKESETGVKKGAKNVVL